ncbi:hypothetical protein [Janthinobacterium sp. PC23-8]|uniref:hypothetical protein n=1 Tax=Janthinobacterium sp. PC23-8 TaxID=2012679 RepID=UPI00113FCC98|nr:hypothetical protein [Janthinobacterium sp. PC23-8]
MPEEDAGVHCPPCRPCSFLAVGSCASAGGLAGPTLLATSMTFFVGNGVIVVFLRIVSRRSYWPFVAWRIVPELFVQAPLQMGVIAAH